ncbi:hypothetical protein [Sedimenticola selenatireducens]|uniref:5'-methylthioadenosine/S-adenosylhomocysteine nucleosidase family protein n=1 Tax=Sedimenticola selenatireducens TaxID=191960 RepID=UPI00048DA1E2|nr:hypothetical protein [Sedimenticola selenatireducens]
MENRSFDIGVIIPLREEYRYILEVAPQIDAIEHEGSYFYVLDFGGVSAVACICNSMGTLPALQTTTRLLAFAEIKLLVILGLGGALDGDIAVGDVVVGEEVNEFQANSKAEAAGDSYEIRYSGRHWPLQFSIREAIGHFEFAAAASFAEWQADASHDFQDLAIPRKEEICSELPSLHIGPIASGNTVAASTAFVEEVKRVNRKFAAIDMESAGAVSAASDRVHPVPCLVVRGMSDHANEGKKSLDEQGKRAWRRYCVRNAASFLKHLLAWDGFKNACSFNVATHNTFGDLLCEAIQGLKGSVGGRWLLAVTFEYYFHGPHATAGGSIVPMDVSRLRIESTRFSMLLDEADAARQALEASRDVKSAVSRFASLAHSFQAEFKSAAIDSLLNDFDQVAAASMCPDDGNDASATLLLQAERLEEEVGLEAVAEYLVEVGSAPAAVRERLVQTWAELKRWGEIVCALKVVPFEDLTRSELENLIFAFAATGDGRMASTTSVTHKEKYTDKAAKLFQQQLAVQFPFLGGK